MSRNRILLRRTIEEAEGYIELGMNEHALRSLQRRGALVHGNGRACYLMGETLRELSRYEEALLPLGFKVLRVRDLHPVARIEIGIDELERAVASREELERALAFAYERVELAAYRPGGSLTSPSPSPEARRS